MRSTAVLAGLVGLTLALPALAEIYRWTDEDGRVHFGDRPPRERKAENISDQAREGNIDQSREEREKLNRLFAPETPEEKQWRRKKEKKLAAERRQRRIQCENAQRRLRFFREERFYWVDEEGNGHNASEEERREAIKQLTTAIERHCQQTAR